MKRAAVFLLGIVACAAPAREERLAHGSAAIQGGHDESASAFAVAVLDDQDGTCSGTLIAPNLVLTARHCVATDNGGDAVDCSHDKFDAAGAASSLRVSADEVANTFSSAEYGVKKVVVPTDATFCGHDIALLILDKVVAPSVAKPATPAITTPKYAGSIDAIGYGTTSPTADDQGTRRRLDSVPIECVPGDGSGCVPDDYAMVAAELAAGAGLCDGDSGSGAYDPASVTAGAPVVLGVLSRGSDVGSKCADAIYERVETFSALLIATAQEAAKTGGYTAPAWAGGPATADAGTGDDASSSSDDDGGGSGSGAAPPGGGSSGGGGGGCAIAPPRASPSGAAAALFAFLASIVLARGWHSRRRAVS